MRCLGDDLPQYWWRDASLLKHEHDFHGSIDRIEAAHGPSSKSLHKWWNRHGLPAHAPGPKVGAFSKKSASETEDAWLLLALKQLGDSASVDDIANLSDVAPRRVTEAFERLQAAGYRLVAPREGEVALKRAPKETGARFQGSPELFSGDLVRFAIVSDVHLSSIAERPDELHTAYDIIEREGYEVVLNAGDISDGIGIYKGQVSEIKHHTFEGQRDHAVEVYPQRKKVVTKIIGGNHDLEGELGRIGADIVQAVCNVRDDMEYLGQYSAWIDLPNGGSIHMLHPMGGASYATSYKPQKIVEGYAGAEKPSLLIIGHWHRMGFFSVRNVQTLLAGTFQGPTTYSLRKAFGAPGFGFWLVEATMADDGSLVRFKPEFMPFYSGRQVSSSRALSKAPAARRRSR